MKRLTLCAAALVAALLFTPARAQTAQTTASNYQGNPAHTGFADVPGLAPPLKRKWVVNFGEPASYPVIAEGRVFVTVRKPLSTYGTKLHALDAATGAPLWGPIDLGGIYWWSALCYENGRVFVLNYDGLLRAFDAATGSLVWSRQLPNQWSFDSAPTVRNGVVYAGGSGSGGTLYAVSADTGTVLWTTPVANGDNSSPAVGDEGVFVSYACLRAYGFNGVSGALLWRNLTGCSGGGGRTTALHGGRLYARDQSLGNKVFDAQTGALLLSFVSRSIPAFSNDLGFFMNGQQSSLGSKLEARELGDLGLRWSFAGDGRLMSAPLVVNDHVYVGSTAGNLYALEAATGGEVWSTHLGAELPFPEEHGVGQPLTGFGAAEGMLVVATKSSLVAFERDFGSLVTWGERSPAANAAGWNNTPVELPFTVDQSAGRMDYFPDNPLRFDAEGANQTQEVFTMNVAGAINTFTSPAVNIDMTAPATAPQISGGGASNNGWLSGPVTVRLSASDNLSGVAATYYTVVDGQSGVYAGPLTISADGAHELYFASVDKAGNVEADQSVTVKIDANAPTTRATVSGTPNAAGWHKAAVQVSLAATDGGSGVTGTYYSVDGGEWRLYSAPFTVAGDGAHAVSYHSVDRANHGEEQRTLAVNIDGGAPATQFSASGTAGNDGWLRGNVQISLAAADAHSGVAQTFYTLDGGAAQTYNGAFNVSADGAHTVSYWSADRAGNAEAARSSVVKIDATAPATEAAVSGTQGAGGWYQTSARVTLAATDATSGVAQTFYTVDGGATQTYSAPFDVPAGSHAISYWSVDAAGGTEQQRTLAVNVDAGAPTTQLDAAGTAGGGGWYRSNVQVTLTSSDAQSGVGSTHYSVDGGATQTYAGAFAVTGNGRHQVSFWSVDRAGNAEPARTFPVNIDFTGPTAQNAVTGPAGNSVYFRGPVQFSITAEDNLSGVASIQYRIAGGPTQTYSGTFTVSGDGAQLVEFWGVDVAGNITNTYGSMIRIDSTAPATQAAVTTTPGDNGWSRGPAQVALTASDALSGVQAIYYSVNGGVTQSYTGALAFSAAGVHTVNFWGVDQANNAEPARSVVVRVDADAPAVTAAANPATRPKGKNPVSVTISGRITDAASGVRPGSANFFVTDEYGLAQPSGAVVVQADGSYSFSLSLPATRNSRDLDGHRYTITVRALDQAGNAGAASTVFTIL